MFQSFNDIWNHNVCRHITTMLLFYLLAYKYFISQCVHVRLHMCVYVYVRVHMCTWMCVCVGFIIIKILYSGKIWDSWVTAQLSDYKRDCSRVTSSLELISYFRQDLTRRCAPLLYTQYLKDCEENREQCMSNEKTTIVILFI